MNAVNAHSGMAPIALLAAAMALGLPTPDALAQAMDHSKMKMPMPAAKPAPTKADPKEKEDEKQKKKPAESTAPREPVKPAKAAPAAVHPANGSHPAAPPGDPRAKPTAEPMHQPAMDHSAMDHAAMGLDMDQTQDQAMPMDHADMGHGDMHPAPTEPVTPIPILSDADRAAADRPTGGHVVHDNGIYSFVMIDRLETWNADEGNGVGWEAQAWIGTDLDRLWLRSEGERVGSRTESADLEVLYGRSVGAWWDVVAGIRHDFKPGGSQDFVALGVMGLAPYKFEIAATAYLGQSGQTAARIEAEYETLFTNRLILQWFGEVDLYGKQDAARGIGAGLSTVEAGLRLRYEFTRRFAPYLGIVHERAYAGTADLRRIEGQATRDTRLVAGLHIWF